ncbi:TetR/AcrR family transcriptional regulator [Streptomyces sp. NPDC049954]|uniref:TetR/AcrR family transcriptional regulator n=1 Tax=Streptomyces sp. NPDC049954 TaxID=3155779 RepID=UPI003414E7B3
MSVHERKERERADRHRLIVRTARELAESQGWGAVTTRRLAEQIEYSQPVLYSHFRGKREIVGAVAVEGSAELAAALRAAVAGGLTGHAAVGAVARAYVDFAERNPALYDALFLLDNGLRYAEEDTPAALREAFAALGEPFTGYPGSDGTGLVVETFWAALHGLVTLTRAGRLPAEAAADRLTLLADRFAPRPQEPAVDAEEGTD